MNHRLSLGLAGLCALLVGCQPAALGPGLSVTPLRASSATPIELLVKAPAALASGGQLLSDLGAGLISRDGGHLLSDLGAGLVASSLQPNFGLLQAPAPDAAVGQAAVELRTLDGKPVGKAALADADGKVVLSARGSKPLTAVALFGAGGKVYRLAAVVTPSDAPGSFIVDAINTMVEARVRPILAKRKDSGEVTYDKLKQVWMICNQAGVTADPADLQADRSDAEVIARLQEIWQEALTKVDEADRAVIRDFVASLEAEE